MAKVKHILSIFITFTFSNPFVMKIYFLLFLFVLQLGITFSNAQYSKPVSAKITLKSGKIIEGLVSYPVYTNEKLKIKGENKQTVNRNEIAEVEFASDSATIQFIPITGYKNARNKSVQEGILVEKMLELENISLFRGFALNKITTGGAGGAMNTFISIDVFWYCKRPNEEVATVVSWTFNSNITQNKIFQKNAAEYFKDYPDLSNKIKNKVYKYDQILDVVQEYNTWKSK